MRSRNDEGLTGAQRSAEARRRSQSAKQKLAAKQQLTNGKTEHLQAEPSRDVRKERLPGSCKERPKQNKGSGKGRAFVPWCSRR